MLVGVVLAAAQVELVEAGAVDVAIIRPNFIWRRRTSTPCVDAAPQVPLAGTSVLHLVTVDLLRS